MSLGCVAFAFSSLRPLREGGEEVGDVLSAMPRGEGVTRLNRSEAGR
jgi:hypothetical protein